MNNRDELDDLDLFIRYYHNNEPTHYFVNPVNKGVYSEFTGKLLTPSYKNGYAEYRLRVNGKIISKTYKNLLTLR